jgi:hypothetical protein
MSNLLVSGQHKHEGEGEGRPGQMSLEPLLRSTAVRILQVLPVVNFHHLIL